MNPKLKALLIGSIGGAVLGASFAWIATDVGDEEELPAVSQLGPGDYIALAIAILTLARQFNGMLKK